MPATCRPNKKNILYNVTTCTCNKYSLFTWSSCREDWLVPVGEGKILEFLLFEVSSWLVQIFNGLYMLFATLLKYGVREPSINFSLALNTWLQMFGYKAWVTKGGTVHETVEPDFVSFLFSCFSSFNYYTCSLPPITIHSQVEII